MNHEEFENLAALDAIGATSLEEGDSLKRHLAGCAACATAARDFSEAAALLAQSLEPVNPPAAVRQQILDSVGGSAHLQTAETTLVGWRSRRMKPVWWLATAATFFLALWGWSELRVRTVQSQIDELQASNKSLQETARRLEREKQTLRTTIDGITSAQTRTISLSGQQIARSAAARVYLDAANRQAFVFFYGLPPNPGDKSYELWIIRADSADPQPAGVFDVDQNGEAEISVQNLPVDTELKGFAVTLEPRGGTTAPTGPRYM